MVQPKIILRMKNDIVIVGMFDRKKQSTARVYNTEGVAPTLTTFMGTGGGNVPLIMIDDES